MSPKDQAFEYLAGEVEYAKSRGIDNVLVEVESLSLVLEGVSSLPASPSVPTEGQSVGGSGSETWASMAAWTAETFGAVTLARIATRANEEMQELLADPSDVMEAADVCIVLSRYPGIADAIDRKMAINRARKWKLNGDGSGYHVKEATTAAPSDTVAVDHSTYLSAVSGRMAFRDAFRRCLPIVRAAEALASKWVTGGQKVDSDDFYAAINDVWEAVAKRNGDPLAKDDAAYAVAAQPNASQVGMSEANAPNNNTEVQALREALTDLLGSISILTSTGGRKTYGFKLSAPVAIAAAQIALSASEEGA